MRQPRAWPRPDWTCCRRTRPTQATVPTADPQRTQATLTGEATFIELFEQTLQTADGTVTYDAGRIHADLSLSKSESLKGKIVGDFTLDAAKRIVDIRSLTIDFQNGAWRLMPTTTAASVSWGDGVVSIAPMTFVDNVSGSQRIGLGGTWRQEGGGGLDITTRGVFLETITGAIGRPAVYGGVIDLDAKVGGTAARPTVLATVSITDGRVRRLSYKRLAGKVDYSDQYLEARLEARPGA